MSAPAELSFDRRTSLFVALAAAFVTMLVVGDIIGGKLQVVEVAGFSFIITVGMIPFPVTFLLTDVLNEFYGKRAARFVTWVGFGLAALTFVIISICVALPWPEMTRASDWGGVNEASYDRVFGGSKRFLAASMTAYLVAQFVDIAVFQALKRLTHNKLLWLRATGSTAVSQMVDTVVITSLAWWGVLPLEKMLAMMVSSYVVKLVIAVGLTPLVYGAHALIERRLDIKPLLVPESLEPTKSPK